jgi:L-cysteine desulfidase
MLKEVLKHEVFPALGCTEPIAVAYAASAAGKELNDSEIHDLHIIVDPGVYKNGLAVHVPNTQGERGNLIAGVLGALIKQPELKMEIMKGVTDELINQAKAIIQAKKARVVSDNSKEDLYIEVRLQTETGTARAVTQYGHTNLVLVEKTAFRYFKRRSRSREKTIQIIRSC